MVEDRSQPIYSQHSKIWADSRLLSNTSTIKPTNIYGFLPRGSNQETGFETGFRGSSQQECIRRSERSLYPRVLREIVHTPKTRGAMENHNRSIRLKQFCDQPFFQDGDPILHPRLYETRNVVHFNRSNRRLLSYSHSSNVQEIHEGGIVRESVPIHRDAHGFEHLGQDIYQSHRGGDEILKGKRLPHECIHRRLVSEKLFETSSSHTDTGGIGFVRQTGSISEPAKIRSRGVTNSGLCGSALQFSRGASQTPREKCNRIREVNNTGTQTEASHCQSLGQCDRKDGSDDETSQIGSITSPAHTKTHAHLLESEWSELGRQDSSEGLGGGTSRVVVREKEHNDGCPASTIQTRPFIVHRCKRMGLGSDSGDGGEIGEMVPDRVRVTLKQQRDVSGDKGNTGVQVKANKLKAPNLLGQHDNGVGHQQTGWHEVLVTNRPSVGTLGVSRRDELRCESTSCPGQVECESGHVVQSESSDLVRMGDSGGGPLADLETVGHPGGGHVRDMSQPQTGLVCISSPRSRSMGSECIESEMDRDVPVCLSPLASNPGDIMEGEGGKGGDDINSSKMGEKSVVSSTIGVSNRQSSTSTKVSRSANTDTLRSIMQGSRNVKSTCLETVRKHVKKQGFSDKVAARIANNVRQSSQKIYAGKWDSFCKWAKSKGISNPIKANVQQIADFLNHKFEVDQLEVSTIQGYRAAICRVLKLAGKEDLSHDTYLNALVNNFSIERPITKKVYPSWDLITVLKSLMKLPYEPASAATRAALTKKCAFLLLLASGARRSEIHALDVNRITWLSDKEVLLQPKESFIAKNLNTYTGRGEFEGFKLTALKDFVGPDLDKDNLLCPVRTLKIYLKRTKDIRGDIRDLLLTCNDKGPVKGAHVNTLSGWIKRVISQAYQVDNSNSGSLLHRATHEIRAQSASYAVYGNVSIDQIMRQCRWANHSTFTNFYLRDLAGRQGDMWTLPPIVSAGAVLNSKSHSRRKKKEGGSRRRHAQARHH